MSSFAGLGGRSSRPTKVGQHAEVYALDNNPLLDAATARFRATASDYATSPAHAAGADLQRLVELAGLLGDERVLDVATGAGHTALAFAPHVGEVIGCDPTPEMLREAVALAQRRGIFNVHFERAVAEKLPYADAAFDVVVTRVAPHHFADPEMFVREAARVLRRGGRLMIDDQIAPDERELDAFMNEFERRRDPSHVRAYTLGEWRRWIDDAGLRVESTEPFERGSYDFVDWTARARMAESDRDSLERWLLAAPPRYVEYFKIESTDGHVRSLRACFAIIVARK